MLYLSTWYLRLCEPHWPQATWSSSGRKALETNKSQRTFLPRRSFPCLCLMGTQAVIALAPSCLLVLEGRRYCYLASLPGLPASVQLHPSPSSRMISSYPELSGMFFPPLSGMVTHFHSSLCYPEMLLSLFFHYPKELCSLISSSRIQKYYSL